jgi:tRNA 2-selenouridine synthase
MAVRPIDIDTFLNLRESHPVLDVRSPGEYQHAHIPGAHSFPLFDDEERKQVGTAYKQESRELAIKIGLDYFGPKMRALVEQAESISAQSGSRTLLVHCWRGGMRSGALAWLLDIYGFQVHTLIGGYKSFRRWSLAQFEKEYPLQLIGGYTGSGKTDLLEALKIRRKRYLISRG